MILPFLSLGVRNVARLSRSIYSIRTYVSSRDVKKSIKVRNSLTEQSPNVVSSSFVLDTR